jgi:hypothetical protein
MTIVCRFCPDNFWLLDEDDMSEWERQWAMGLTKAHAVLHHLYFTLPFERRVVLLRQQISADAKLHQHSPGVELVVRRSHLVQDGFLAINSIGKGFRGRVRVKFVDDNGVPEDGIDMGGVFKEFLDTMCRQVFSPEYGLFNASAAGQLYPSSLAGSLGDSVSTLEFRPTASNRLTL